MSRKPRVFISYRRKPAAHTVAVAALAKRLSDEGSMEILFDEYAGDPPEGWIRWMRKAVRSADKVLLVFNEPYQRCYEGDDENADEGKGSTFEGITIVGDFYNKKGHNDKYRAVILQGTDREYVSVEFQRHTIYSPNDPHSYEQLLIWIHRDLVAEQKKAEQVDELPAMDASLAELLTRHRQRLERECAVIPIFGRIREDIPMERNFINLTLEATFSETSDARGDKQVVPHARQWKGADRGEREEHERELSARRSRSASEIWAEFAKGVILGLPGAGKTTILRHFAHLDFTQARSRLVLFIPCRSLTQAHLHPSLYRSGATALQRALAQVAAAYLFPSLTDDSAHLTRAQVRCVQEFLPTLDAAWKDGTATVLVDAFDETLPALRGQVADLCKELLLALQEPRLSKKKSVTRCFVSARYNEDQTFRDLQSPIFEVNPLDQEQMRDFARNLFTEESETYRRFDSLVWQEPVLQKMGRTPLTALLLLCYFDIYQRFDLRFRTYDLVLKFALLQVWDSIKGGAFQRDPRRVRQFFEEAASGAFEKQHPTLALRYEALGYLCHTALYQGAEGKVERRLPAATITGSFEMVLEGKTPDPATTAQQWLEELRHEHLLICDGRDYVFVHGTVQEFLAAHYLVHHLDDKSVVEAAAVGRVENGQQVTDSHETLPIACGHTFEHTARLFPLLKPYFPEWARHRLLFRCLVEAESLEYRLLREQRTIPLREREISRLAPKVRAREWAYTLLARTITHLQTRELDEWARWLAEEMRLSRSLLASLHFTRWWEGQADPLMSAATEHMLGLMLSREVLEERLANRQRREFTERAGQMSGTGSYPAAPPVLRVLDQPGDPEDKDFARMRCLCGPELAGVLGSPNFRHGAAIFATAYAPDGRIAWTGGSDGWLRLWDLETGRELLSFQGHQGPVTACALCADGQRLLSGSLDRTLKLWDAASGQEIRCFQGHQGSVNACALSADGQRLLSGSDDRTLKLWDATSGREIRSFQGHQGPVRACALSADGQRLLSGSLDRTLKLWDAASGQEIRSFQGHQGPVRACALSADGQRLLSGSVDRTLKLWDAASGKEIRSWNLPHAALSVTWREAPPKIWPERRHGEATQVVAVGLTNGTVLLFDLTEV